MCHRRRPGVHRDEAPGRAPGVRGAGGMQSRSPFRGSVRRTEQWQHFRFECASGIATVTLDRPAKLNALTFESYADLRDLLAELSHRADVRVLVVRGAGRAFCSGGDVHEIIGATLPMGHGGLLEFTPMSGAVVPGIRGGPIPHIPQLLPIPPRP